MKIKELREKEKKELEELLIENREKLRDLRFKVVSRQFKNIKEIGKAKKLIAQILTIIKEK